VGRTVFWGNSYHSNTDFKLQKRIIRIMVGLEIEIHAENIPENKKYCHYSLNIYILTLTVCD
jgi:hypothetical protein